MHSPLANPDMTETKSMSKADHIDQLPPSEETADAYYSKEEERKAMRKLDRYLIPMLGAINLCSFLDRGNIGNAYAAGMGKAWSITSGDFAWLITGFFIAYICFQWLVLAWKLVPPPVLVLCSAFGFGTVSILQSATTSFGTLFTCRFFLGVFEAAFVPGIALYLSFFYTRQEMGLRYGLFISSAALASCFASALAYAILQAHTSIQGWQLLFIVEGSPTILLSFLAYYVLPKAPDACRFLTARENMIVSTRIAKSRGVEERGKLNLQHVFAAFYDYKNYMTAVIIFCVNTTYNSLPAFLPTIIADIGIGGRLESQGLTAPPYLVAFLLCVTMSTISDRLAHRGTFTSLLCCTGAVGYLLLSVYDTPSVRYFATFLVCGGCFPAVPLTFTWTCDNAPSESKRGAGLVIFGIIGQAGSIVGAQLFPASEGPKFAKGMTICAGLLFFASVVALVLSAALRIQNRARDKYQRDRESVVEPSTDVDIGAEDPRFRYIT